jgi:hypothetical protein
MAFRLRWLGVDSISWLGRFGVGLNKLQAYRDWPVARLVITRGILLGPPSIAVSALPSIYLGLAWT